MAAPRQPFQDRPGPSREGPSRSAERRLGRLRVRRRIQLRAVVRGRGGVELEAGERELPPWAGRRLLLQVGEQEEVRRRGRRGRARDERLGFEQREFRRGEREVSGDESAEPKSGVGVIGGLSGGRRVGSESLADGRDEGWGGQSCRREERGRWSGPGEENWRGDDGGGGRRGADGAGGDEEVRRGRISRCFVTFPFSYLSQLSLVFLTTHFMPQFSARFARSVWERTAGGKKTSRR